MVKPWTSDQARAIVGRLLERQRLLRNLLLAAGADRAGKSRERGIGGLVQRRPRHIETLGAEHQPVHAGMRLRVGDIGPGPRHRLLERRGGRGAGGRHRGVELAKADRGEFADEAGEVAEMMGRRGMRHAGLARHRAQRQAGKPVALQHPLGGLEQRIAQRAVMIGRVLAAAAAAGRAAFARRRAGAVVLAARPDARSRRVSVFLPCQSYRSRF